MGALDYVTMKWALFRRDIPEILNHVQNNHIEGESL
jgi:hypothetical protein